MRKNVSSTDRVQVADARGGARFSKGHISNSQSAPFTELLNDDRTLRPPQEILRILSEKGLDLEKDIISTCGSGITAAILAHALYFSLGKETPVYDGSWTEWKVRAPHLIGRVEDE